MMADFIVTTSVDEDDIDDTDLAMEALRQEIRNHHIRQASVTVVLHKTFHLAADGRGCRDSIQHQSSSNYKQ